MKTCFQEHQLFIGTATRLVAGHVRPTAISLLGMSGGQAALEHIEYLDWGDRSQGSCGASERGRVVVRTHGDDRLLPPEARLYPIGVVTEGRSAGGYLLKTVAFFKSLFQGLASSKAAVVIHSRQEDLQPVLDLITADSTISTSKMQIISTQLMYRAHVLGLKRRRGETESAFACRLLQLPGQLPGLEECLRDLSLEAGVLYESPFYRARATQALFAALQTSWWQEAVC